MSEPNKGGRHWPWILAGLLVANAAASGLLIGLSSASGSHAVEPDYYAKAVAWDDEMAQQRLNRELGWKLESQVAPQAAGALAVRAVLTDRNGAPITGASVALETFHRAHASDRLELDLHEVEPGVYTAVWSSTHFGLWELRYQVHARDKLFTLRDLREAVR